ncbi:MAG: hypothetical protein QOG35_1449 [Solirubrobacteraceae bacterium]|nr:hypothetical protein [Solirubrobacteraceae bacterium]
MVLALVLGWPREDSRLPSGSFDPTTLGTTYHSAIVGSGHTLEGAVGPMLLLAIVLALVGLGVGYVLVELGVVKKDDLGAE